MVPVTMFALLTIVQPSEPTFDAADARTIFTEFQAMCEADAGATWGVSLCGKMMLVDRETRQAFFNAPPPIAHDGLGGGLYVGRYPDDYTLANTSIDWNGQRWVQLIEKPGDIASLRALLMHEAYHAIQGQLGFNEREGSNEHLEEEQGRYWVRLEANALASALNPDGDWRAALADAMRFNREREIAFPGARLNEASQVNHEGLAEYTGVLLGGGENAGDLAIADLASVETRPSLVRSLGYVLGPAYALLLDRLHADWKAAALRGVPLPTLIEASLDPVDAQVAAAGRYDEARIATEEQRRNVERQATLAALRQRFVEGPVLHLPFVKMNISFDPNRVTALGDVGTIRTGASVIDDWGKLTADGDLLVSKSWSFAVVPLDEDPVGRRVVGDGWVLDLADGWTLVPGTRAGDWTLQAPR